MSTIKTPTLARSEPLLEIPFTGYDFGWIVLCIGMAIGSGIVFMPVQVGLKGGWVFLTAIALSYPAVYHLQNLFLRTLMQSEVREDYAGAISHYLGKNWGIALAFVYFVMLFGAIVTYATSITYDSASYLQTFHITDHALSDNGWYSLALIAVLVVISAQGERLLFKVAGPMVAVKFTIIVAMAVVMVPHWNVQNILRPLDVGNFVRDVLTTLPFALFSILYVQILNPMNIAYRKLESDPRVAAYRIVRANRIAYAVLVVSVLFFAFSFAFTISQADAAYALEHNISALAIVAKVMPGAWVKAMSVMLDIFAIVSAFFGIYLGFNEAVRGIVLNMSARFVRTEYLNKSAVDVGVTCAIVLMLWVWVSANFSTMLILQLTGPTYGITTCLVPSYLAWRVPSLRNLRGGAVYFVFLYGLLLMVSPLFRLFE
ncbi:transporter [Paraburkholderia piptadeniae]|uniref:Transporter n=1 Tax=Paraburkholderia piptadeniae TaxID=1701573 RepID=A0A1N7RVG1_9BURK|nr:amino acid permease [Paraburkholderia piptadeniae]SIT39077.1 transporter [Paraburkholderia piptadeniae]